MKNKWLVKLKFALHNCRVI